MKNPENEGSTPKRDAQGDEPKRDEPTFNIPLKKGYARALGTNGKRAERDREAGTARGKPGDSRAK